MSFYQSLRTAKACAIGTIMPWTGDITEIPKGWIPCNGQSVLASEYPLLAQTIGTTYGQSGFGGVFPNYAGSIGVPNLNDSHLADIDSNYFGSTSFPISTLTLSGAIGTLSLAVQHGLRPGAQFSIEGASPAGWNGTYTAITVTNTDITFAISTSPSSPASTPGNLKIRKTVNAEVDNTTEALPTVTSYIGADGSIAAPTVIDDAYTDIVFAYDNVNATNKTFTGKMSGANLVAGTGTRTVYSSARKLGRQHASSHGHSGSFESIRNDDPNKPGRGVGVWTAFNAVTNTGYGGINDNLYTRTYIYGLRCSTGVVNNGTLGAVLANVGGNVMLNSWSPLSMIANQTAPNAHPISNWLGINSDKTLFWRADGGSPSSGNAADFFIPGTNTLFGGVLAKAFDGPQTAQNVVSNIIPFGPGGNSVNVPYRNFTPAGPQYGDGINGDAIDKDDMGNKILYNSNAIDFTVNSGPSSIIPHQHDSFDVEFSMGNLGLPTSVNVTAESQVVPDNASNVGALNLTLNNSQPAMICLYLIRAY